MISSICRRVGKRPPSHVASCALGSLTSRDPSRRPPAAAAAALLSSRLLQQDEPWNDQLWLQGKNTLNILLSQQPSLQTRKASVLVLLERLLKERPNELEPLNALVQTWQAAWKDGKNVLSPPQMLDWVDGLASVDVSIYRLLLDAASYKRRFLTDQREFVGSLLIRILEHKNDPTLLLYDVHKVMRVHIDHKQLQTAESLLEILESFDVQPTNDTYALLLKGWANLGQPQQATAMLQRMIDTGTPFPTKDNFETCLEAWCQYRGWEVKRSTLGQRAELLLLKMKELSDAGHDLAPDSNTIRRVVEAWTSSKRKDASVRGLALLNLAREQGMLDSTSNACISAHASVMRAFAMSGEPQQCEKILEQLSRVDMSLKQRTKLQGLVLLAWARYKGDKNEAAQHAQALFNSMGQADRASYNALLECWARAANGDRAHAIMKEMIARDYLPNTRTWNAVLLAYSRSSTTMKKDQESSQLMTAESVFLQAMETTDFQPDVVTLNALLSALGGTSSVETARRGEVYLEQLLQQQGCTPNVVTYTKAILLWSNVKTPLALERTQALLNEMLEQGLRPEDTTYKALLTVLANTNLSSERITQLRAHFDELLRKR
jgi:pentatricopeptide repeat protein